MLPHIKNALVDFKMDYVYTDDITGLEKEKIIKPIEKCVDIYKQELELRIKEKVIVVADYKKSATGLIVMMHAYLEA